MGHLMLVTWFLDEHYATIYAPGGGCSSGQNYRVANLSVRFWRQCVLHSWLHQPRPDYLERASTQFHVTDVRTSYHLLLLRLWIHKHKDVFHVSNALKPFGKAKRSTSKPLNVRSSEMKLIPRVFLL